MSSGDASAAAPAPDPADQIAAHRSMLFGVAYRLLGTRADAEDVLQDAYLRWRDASAEARQPRRYLTRIVTRLALDRLRARRRHESYVGMWLPEPLSADALAPDPLETAEQRDSVATATMHVMERLDRVERAVFVLRSAFELPYDEISEIVERDPAHCRQLYRRANRRLAEGRRRFAPSRQEHAHLLDGFLRAARYGDLDALREVLHQDVIAWSDGGGRVKAARNAVLGADKVARFFAGIYGPHRSVKVVTAQINGSPGAVIRAHDGGIHALTFAVHNGRISGLYLVLNPDKLTGLAAEP